MRTRQNLQVLAACGHAIAVACVELHAQAKPHSAELVGSSHSRCDNEPAGALAEQKQKATEHLAQTTEPFTIAVCLTPSSTAMRLKLICQVGQWDLRRLNFFEQTEWVLRHIRSELISFLVHEGDIVADRTPPRNGHRPRKSHVCNWTEKCYCMCLETMTWVFWKADNKYGAILPSTGPTHFNHLLSSQKFAERPRVWRTSPSDRHDNSGITSRPQGLKFLMSLLSITPRPKSLIGRTRIVAEHPDHPAIVLTTLPEGNSEKPTISKTQSNKRRCRCWQKFVRKPQETCSWFSAVTSGRGRSYLPWRSWQPGPPDFERHQGLNKRGRKIMAALHGFQPRRTRSAYQHLQPRTRQIQKRPFQAGSTWTIPWLSPSSTVTWKPRRPGESNGCDISRPNKKAGAEPIPPTATESPAASLLILGAATWI